MVTMFAKHRVKDYDEWKRTYDQFGSTRRERGVTGASVHRDAEDSNLITIIHEFDDLDTARSFAGSEELKSAMKNAGVLGRPDIWFTEDVERTPH